MATFAGVDLLYTYADCYNNFNKYCYGRICCSLKMIYSKMMRRIFIFSILYRFLPPIKYFGAFRYSVFKRFYYDRAQGENC